MKTAVIYISKTGFTEKYARWIAEETGADLYKISKATANLITDYDTIIYGASLHAAGILGLKKILKILDKHDGINLAVFATGASPNNNNTISEVRKANFSKEQENIPFFYLRGGFNFSNLNPIDKLLMLLMKIILVKTKNKTADEMGMLSAFKIPVDFTKKANINKLVDYVKSL